MDTYINVFLAYAIDVSIYCVTDNKYKVLDCSVQLLCHIRYFNENTIAINWIKTCIMFYFYNLNQSYQVKGTIKQLLLLVKLAYSIKVLKIKGLMIAWIRKSSTFNSIKENYCVLISNCVQL